LKRGNADHFMAVQYDIAHGSAQAAVDEAFTAESMFASSRAQHNAHKILLAALQNSALNFGDNHMRSRRSALALIVAAAASANGAALANEAAYPQKPIKIIVPYPPGGTTDLLVRTINARLQQALGQPVVIENRGGASGTIGADAVAKSAPDGYTLLIGAAHQTIAQSVFPKLPYSIATDLAPITLMAMVPNVLVVHPAVPARSVAQFIEISKRQPDKYSYGSVGPGTAHHLIGEMFKLQTGASLIHVPYKGSGPAVVDLIGGQIDAMFDSMPSALPHVKAGKTRALGVTTAKRSSALPDVPTLDEAGVKGFDVGTWFGLFAPAGTPHAIIARLNKEVAAALAEPSVRKQLLEQGVEPSTSTPAELKARVDKDLADFSALAKRAKLSTE
jgi:tripartite-type tricarboxylate transporter receptor subunit TctC